MATPNESFNEHEVKDATPEEMRKALDEYFEHVQQYAPKDIEFALVVTGHNIEGGKSHVCSMLGGQPHTLAHAIVALMDELTERNPMAAAFFFMSFMKRIYPQQDIGGPDVEAQVKGLIDKLRSNASSGGSVH